MSVQVSVAWAGFGLGLVLGAAGRLSSFCLYRGLEESWAGGDGRPLRTFALALLVALIGTQLLLATGWIDLSQTPYLRSSFSVPAVFLGGALFGAGMVLANGCGFRALVLLGGGNLRSLVVLLCLGTAAHAALTGVLGTFRSALGQVARVEIAGTPTLPGLLARAGLPPAWASLLVVGAITVALSVFIARDRAFRRAPALVAGGVIVGLCIVAGWVVTGVLGADDFDPVPVASASFVVPAGDALLYLMQATGRTVGFGPALVAGVVCGSLILAALRGEVRIEGFSVERPIERYLAGGVAMGIGGVLAIGCSIGQGLTGSSTLALASVTAMAGILAGTALALRLGSRAPGFAGRDKTTREETA